MNVANARMAILIFLFQKGALDRVAIIGGTSVTDYTTNMPTRPHARAVLNIAMIRFRLCRMSAGRNKFAAPRALGVARRPRRRPGPGITGPKRISHIRGTLTSVGIRPTPTAERSVRLCPLGKKFSPLEPRAFLA
jgi:hypothetical protein